MVSRRGFQFFGLFLVLAFVVAIGVAPSEAIPLIRFDQDSDQDTQDGVISWAGGAAPLVGKDIGFNIIAGLFDLAGKKLKCDPFKSGFGKPCMLLEFTSGAFSGESAGALAWKGGFSPTTEFVVTLTDDDALGLGLSAGDELLTGTAMFRANLSAPGGPFRNLSITGLDTKHEEILKFFFPGGAPLGFGYADTEITLGSGPIDLDAGFSFAVTNADIDNVPAPEPGTSLLLLLGLSGLAMRRRFR